MLIYSIISLCLPIEIVVRAHILCDDAHIDAATRLPDNNVIVFKGKNYYYLNGLPGDAGSLSAANPIKARWPNMAAPVKAVMSTTTGHSSYINHTYEFYKRYYRKFSPTGKLLDQLAWAEIPKSYFKAAVHNGDPKNAWFVAFDGEKTQRVHYFSSTGIAWVRINGNPKPGGKHNFPEGVEAALGLKDGTLYLFKGTEHCKRTFNTTTKCEEWKPNEVLFGCYGYSIDPDDPNYTGSPDRTRPPKDDPALSIAINLNTNNYILLVYFLILTLIHN